MHLRLLTGNVCLSEVRLDSPFARVSKDGETFNFSDILERFSSADSAKPVADSLAMKDSAAKQFPFGISVKRIAILSGNIQFDDNGVNSHIRIKDFSLRIPEVYFSNKKTSLGVNLEFADGGTLRIDSDYGMRSGDFSVNVHLSKFSLSLVEPYLETALNFKSLSGDVGADISLSGNVDDVLASVASGRVSLENVVLTENSGKTMGLEALDVRIIEANLKENRFVVDSVSVRGAFVNFDLFKNSNNVEALLAKKSAPEASSADSAAAGNASSAKLPDLLVKNFSVSVFEPEVQKHAAR